MGKWFAENVCNIIKGRTAIAMGRTFCEACGKIVRKDLDKSRDLR